MLRTVFLLVTIAFAGDCVAQLPDNIRLRAPSSTLDSTGVLVNQKLDQVNAKGDSLFAVASVGRLKDSLKVEEWSNTLESSINKKFSSTSITRKLDSLRSIGIPSGRISKMADSLSKQGASLFQEVEGKKMTLQKKLAERHTNWLAAAQKKLKLDSFRVSKLASITTAIPSTELSPGGIPGLGMPSLKTEDFASLGLSNELRSVGGDMAVPSPEKIQALELNLQEMPDPMKQISAGTSELNALKEEPGTAAEKAVGNISEVSSATKELEQAEQLTKNNEALQYSEQIKDPEGVQEAFKREAMNHFAGKEAVLQSAMDNMDKYKDRYSSLPSLTDVKKNWLPINSLKGVPFRIRIRVGMNLGFRTLNDTLLLDLFPNASYRISGRFEAGMGFMYRLRLNTREFAFNQVNPVWGWNTFVIAKTFKAVFLRFEVDGNSYPTSGSAETGSRDWRWSFLSGVQTNLRISGRCTGNVQMLYNFNSALKDGFPERLSLRLGVSWKVMGVGKP